MIICQVKSLTQTGTVKEPTYAYKEIQLCAPSDMDFDTPAVRNIPDTYSCVINKLSPAANVKAPIATKQTSATNVQTSAAIKQIHTSTMRKPAITKRSPAVSMQAPTATVQAPAASTQKPATTKLLPAANTQALAAIKQMPTTTAQAPTTLASPTCKPSSNQAPMGQPATCQPSASLCPPMPAGQSPSTPLGNIHIGKSGKKISPKPNLGGTAAQFGSLPNGEWTDRLSNNGNHAPNSVNEFGCMKKTKLALCQCKLGSSQTFSVSSHPSQSRKGITDATQTLGSPMLCLPITIPCRSTSINKDKPLNDSLCYH
ncbi:hypothetical protein DSO57_1023622 [Entomophthora muscae]|uniref:Uncharacterized protein n=1 Tax=Entomophthora muscae TaxID=34485 RepID=A0ACC2UMQ0_9FUNG|nr:hypothetical protein DSO57_1023622 [Entomophthora muscae]